MGYQGHLFRWYEEHSYRYKSDEITQDDFSEEFCILAIQIWFREGILQLRLPIENWSQVFDEGQIPNEIQKFLQKGVDKFLQIVDEMQGLYETVTLSKNKISRVLPGMIESWIEQLNMVIDIFESKILLVEVQNWWSQMILQKLLDLRDDMREILPILEKLIIDRAK